MEDEKEGIFGAIGFKAPLNEEIPVDVDTDFAKTLLNEKDSKEPAVALGSDVEE